MSSLTVSSLPQNARKANELTNMPSKDWVWAWWRLSVGVPTHNVALTRKAGKRNVQGAQSHGKQCGATLFCQFP